MASGAEVLRFQLPGHEAAALRSMNQLRAEERFCDVTIVVAESLKFRGHRVILAACSPFLRDQFLLNPSSELPLSLAHSARVVADLLLSCYTGALQFAVRDLVNYLTAASYLQMEHVVEKCRGALAQLMEPKADPPPPPPPPAALKLEEDDEEDEEDDAVSDICIVKVEPAAEAARRRRKPRAWPKRPAGPQPGPQPGKPPPLGVVKARYSLSEDAEGEGLLIFPGGADAAAAGPCALPSCPAPAAPAAAAVPVPPPAAAAAAPRCTKCGEVFQGVEKLVFHMRAQHFVFMCPRCGKQFNHSSNLNRHMNVHRGVKSHGCGVCGKSFTQKSTLHDHMNLHSGERPYRCSYCDVRFAHKPAIRRHLKEQHGKTTAENVLEASVAEINVLVR